MDFFSQLIAVDWGGLIGAAVASGVGLSLITQVLKAKWVKVPAKKYPRAVSAVLAVLVGIISTISVGLELSSPLSLVVFSVVAFVSSGIAYDVVKRLVAEVKQEEPVTLEIDHLKPNEKIVLSTVNVITPPVDERVSVEIVAQEIIDGKKADGTSWGNGAERKTNLESAGYNFDEVQAKVKELVAKK